MKNDIFGFKSDTPPHEYVECGGGVLRYKKIKRNWVEYLVADDEMNKQYKYTKCETKSMTWYSREKR